MLMIKEDPYNIGPNGMILLGSHEKSYVKGLNKFIDLTESEFDSYYLLSPEVFYIRQPDINTEPIYRFQKTINEGRRLQ